MVLPGDGEGVRIHLLLGLRVKLREHVSIPECYVRVISLP